MTDAANRRAFLGDGDDAFRSAHIGASEVAALFDASPYLTRFELWHRRAGNVHSPDFLADGATNNERIEAGIRLEPAIISWACDRWGYEPKYTPVNVGNGKGLGGHPDQFVSCPERGPGVLEVKTADWLVAKKWGEEPPLHYLLQAQTYAGLGGFAWCDIVALIGGNQLRRFQYEFKPAIFAEIEKRVADFWASVRANDPPPPDFARDRGTLEELLGEPTTETIDLRHDNEADYLATDYLKAKREAKEAGDRAEALRCELLLKIGDAGFALLPSHKISAGRVKDSPPVTITAAMIGETYGGRRGYRRFDVKELEPR